MMNIVEKWNGKDNFWELFPNYKVIDIFNAFYTKDKTKNKEKSSNILWAIAFCTRRESPLYNIPNKWELAARDIVKEEIDWESYDDIVKTFKNISMTQAERSLLAWEELMDKRDKYLKNQEYYFDQYQVDKNGNNVLSRTGQLVTVKGTAEQLDRAFGVTPKMYSDFAKIKKEIEDDDVKRGKGNKPKSMSETDEI